MQEESLLNFPTLYHIKIMGLASTTFEAMVVGILRSHINDLGEGAISCKFSGQSKYMAITATFTAHNKAQLDALYRALTNEPDIIMVL